MKDRNTVKLKASNRSASAQAGAVPEKLNLKRLERHLWTAADILRGKIDSSDYKHYILGLLFYKSLCDVWLEEFQERLTRYGNRERAAAPTEHRFHIPASAFWDDVRQHRRHIGRALNRAFKSIENANARLRGIFQDVNFDNPERFPDATLEQLLGHFERVRLSRRRTEPDILGTVYECLIARFASDAGKTGGEFYTPKQVVRLIVECLEPDEGMSICDPACGSGGMLLEVVHHLRQHGKDPARLRLYGQEMNLNTWAICRINLFLHDIDEAFIARGDTLREPKHLAATGEIMTFDRVLANPPFSLKNWGFEAWQKGDAWGRDLFGRPPKAYGGDLAFVQHMIKSLEPRGRLGVVLPQGALSRGGAEAKIRRGMLQADLVEAVISLPEQLFYGTRISTSILFVHRDKPAERRSKVLLIDGTKETVSGKNQQILSDANVARLVDAFHAFRDIEGFSRVVPVDRILAQGSDLIFAHHAARQVPEEPIDIQAVASELETMRSDRDILETNLFRSLNDLERYIP